MHTNYIEINFEEGRFGKSKVRKIRQQELLEIIDEIDSGLRQVLHEITFVEKVNYILDGEVEKVDYFFKVGANKQVYEYEKVGA